MLPLLEELSVKLIVPVPLIVPAFIIRAVIAPVLDRDEAESFWVINDWAMLPLLEEAPLKLSVPVPFNVPALVTLPDKVPV